MNIFKSGFRSGPLRFLRRTVRLRRENTSVASVSAAPSDKPDDEMLRRMAEELQQKINRRNLDYGIADTGTSTDRSNDALPSAPSQSDVTSASAAAPHNASERDAQPEFRFELQVLRSDADERSDSSKLIEADIAQWVAERRDIAELGQLFKTPQADSAESDEGRQLQLLLPHWRQVRAGIGFTASQDRDEQ